MLETRLGGSSYILDSSGLSADSFLQNAINSHRSVTFQLIPAEDTQEIWQWVVTFAVVLFVRRDALLLTSRRPGGVSRA